MTLPPQRPGQAELLPRYLLIAPLIAGKRVLEMGAVATTAGLTAHFLSLRGAKHVLALDPDSDAIFRASKTVGSPTVQFRVDNVSLVEPGTFDFALVADLTSLDEPMVLALRRALTKSGRLLGGIPHAKGIGRPLRAGAYPTRGRMATLFSPHFASVQVLKQRPVAGYQLSLDDGSTPTLDDSLAGTIEPAYFVLIAGPTPVQLAARTWVQLSSEVLDRGDTSTAAVDPKLRRLEAELQEARIALVDRQAEVHELQRKLAWTEQPTRVENSRGNDKELAGLLQSTHEQLRRAADELKASRAAEAKARNEAAALRVQLEHQNAAAANALDKERARRKELEALVTALENDRARSGELTKALEAERSKSSQLSSALNADRARLKVMEAAKSAASSAMEKTAAKVKELESQLEQERNEAKGRRAGLELQLSHLTTQLDELRAALAEK
ncbi:MAG: hypothetical protein ACOZIN_01915 [Myxococcota bacterium]